VGQIGNLQRVVNPLKGCRWRNTSSMQPLWHTRFECRVGTRLDACPRNFAIAGKLLTMLCPVRYFEVIRRQTRPHYSYRTATVVFCSAPQEHEASRPTKPRRVLWPKAIR
jgi:hypothetical protein